VPRCTRNRTVNPLSSHLPPSLGAISIASEEIEVVVLTCKGSDVHSLTDRRTGIDVLFKTPWGTRRPSLWPTTSNSLERWIDSYAGGWQLILPNGGDECIEQGVTWGFHGEAAMVPWSVLEQTSDRLLLEVDLITSPLHIRREMTVAGPVFEVREVVTNNSSLDVDLMWSHHPAFGAPFVDGSCILSVGCETVWADDVAPGNLMAPGSQHKWPLVTTIDGDIADLRKIPDPNEPRAILAYLKDFSSGYFAITNPTLGLGVGLRWPLEIFDQAWLWQEVHFGTGFPWFKRAYVIAVEPCTTALGQGICVARSKGLPLRRLAGGQSLEVTVQAVLFEGSKAVQGISAEGVVSFAAS